MAEGRASGNARNINYLLQDHSISIEYFDKQMTIAKESNDQIGQRRAYSNLGNVYLYLGDSNKALLHYKEAMKIGEIMNDRLFIAQMNFILGRVHNIKHEYETSIYFHEKHLNLAEHFQDFQGQCLAYLILSQLYEKINQYDKTKKFLTLYKSLERELAQPNETKSETKRNLFKNLRTESICISLSGSRSSYSPRSNSFALSSLISPSDEKSIINANKEMKSNFTQCLNQRTALTLQKQSSKTDPDELVDLVYHMQKSRFDDQRCDITTMNHEHTNKNAVLKSSSSSQLDDILNTVERLQQFRLDDQRTSFPNSMVTSNTDTKSSCLSSLNEEFFDQLAKCQSFRLDDQRATLAPVITDNDKSSIIRPVSAASSIRTEMTSQAKEFINEPISETLPDEDFFSILHRLQSNHSDEQRKRLSLTINLPSKKALQ